MPKSRELVNKRNDHKDRNSRGPAGSNADGLKKGGAGAHNWGVLTAVETSVAAVDRNDPNYDSSEEH